MKQHPAGMLVLMLTLILTFPFTSAEARDSRINTSSLDDDPVKEIPIPVLFGVELDDINPDYGDPRGGGTRQHEGQDFVGPLGAPIISPTKAVVLRTGTGASAGRYVYTVNPGGEIFRYMHLDEIANIKRGDRLAVGDLIGTMGDTGNAPAGVYHLHFETRDDRNRAQDPYDRLVDAFTLKEKVSFLGDVLDAVDDEDEYAELLVALYPQQLGAALNAGYRLPTEIKNALKESGMVDQVEALQELRTVLQVVPKILSFDVAPEDQGAAVTLLQLYLMYFGTGEATDRLIAAGPTGYYGSITTAAVFEYQRTLDMTPTGVYDAATRQAIE